MYGFLHVALVKYVTRQENGEALMEQVFAMAGDEVNPRGNIYKSFTDEETLQLVQATATVGRGGVGDACG